MLNTTSAEYDLQSVYNCISYVGVTTELPQVFLAIYDTTPSPYPCTGSEHIDITDNQISLHVPLKVNGEIVLSPRNYDGAVFEFISCTGMLVFYKTQVMVEPQSQNSIHLQTYVHVIVVVRFQICIITHMWIS